MPKRLMIVDDEIEMWGFLQDTLEEYGYNVISVDSGEKAIRLTEMSFFDAILMDIDMPGVNGIEALGRIKTISPLTAVIMMTAGAMEIQIKKAIAEGAFAVVNKPFKSAVVVDTLQKALNRQCSESSNASVMIIEDDVALALILNTVITNSGYNVSVAENGAKAIQAAKSKVYDAAIIDFRLPDMSGIEVIKKLRTVNKDIVVILMTGYESLELAISAIKEHVHDFLVKPVDPHTITASLMKGLSTKRKTT